MTARILTCAELRRIEAEHAAARPPLMQRAGHAAAEAALALLAGTPGTPGTPLLVAGPGNNGGDAFVMARRLLENGRPPVVLFAADPDRLPADARQAHADWLACGGRCVTEFPAGDFALIVDGLFGIGLTRPIDGLYADWIARIDASGTPVLALDIPSGLNADTGAATGPCVRANHTASFIALKPGLLTGDGPDYCGTVTLHDLGLDPGTAGGQAVSPALFRDRLRPRLKNSHKGSYGSVAILGGAPGMAGAALLAGRAALQLGAGRVYLGMLETLAVDAGQPELMLRTPTDALAQASVLAIGPGLGDAPAARELLRQALALPLPRVIDADGLNLLAADPSLAERIAVSPEPTFAGAVPHAPVFLTPHPAEAARLLGQTVAEVQADRLAAALALAARFKAWVALKGCGTVIATPAGDWYINTTGNPGLATAGSGDVLTGLLAALLAQGWPARDALLAAVHLHGAAADACVRAGAGPVGLTAGELIPAARRLLNDWIH